MHKGLLFFLITSHGAFVEKGIVVGLDANIEYLLPFFYTNLRLHSDLPITFFDYGMTAMGLNFCKKRGEIIEIHRSLFETNIESQSHQIKKAWFKKPLSCASAPYDYNLWIDLDILIRAPFDEVYTPLEETKEISLCQEYLVKIRNKQKNYKTCPPVDKFIYSTFKNFEKNTSSEIPSSSIIPIYNSGFFAFKKNASFIDPWIQLSEKLANAKDNLRIGDQDTLSFTLYDMAHVVAKIPITYNLVIQKPKKIIEVNPLNTKLSLIKQLRHFKLPIHEAKNIHFAAKCKLNFLARHLEFEKLTSHKINAEQGSYV